MSANSLLDTILADKLTFKEQISGPWLGNLNSESIQVTSLEIGSSRLKPPVLNVFPAMENPSAASTVILGNDFLSQFSSVTFVSVRHDGQFLN